MSRARKGDCAGAAPGGALRTAVPAGCHPGSCPRQGPCLPGTPPQGPRQSQAAPRAASEASQLLPLPAPASGRGLPDPQPKCEGRQGSGGTSSLHQRPPLHLDGASRLRENVTPHRHGAGPRPQPRAAQTREQDRTRARDSSEGAQLRVAEPDTPALSPEGRCPSGAPAQGAGPGQARQGLGRHRAEQSQPEQTGGVGRGRQAPPPPPRPARSGRAPPRELVGHGGPRDGLARSFRDVGAAPGSGGEGKLQPGLGRAPELPGNSCSAPRCPPLHRPGPSAVRGQAGLLGSHCPPARGGGGRRPRCPRLPLPGAWPPGYRAGGLGDDLVRRGGHVSTFLKPLLSLGACWRGRCRHWL